MEVSVLDGIDPVQTPNIFRRMGFEIRIPINPANKFADTVLHDGSHAHPARVLAHANGGIKLKGFGRKVKVQILERRGVTFEKRRCFISDDSVQAGYALLAIQEQPDMALLHWPLTSVRGILGIGNPGQERANRMAMV